RNAADSDLHVHLRAHRESRRSDSDARLGQADAGQSAALAQQGCGEHHGVDRRHSREPPHRHDHVYRFQDPADDERYGSARRLNSGTTRFVPDLHADHERLACGLQSTAVSATRRQQDSRQHFAAERAPDAGDPRAVRVYPPADSDFGWVYARDYQPGDRFCFLPVTARSQMTKRIFSGAQPTGNVHLGNYLGALRNWVALQHEYESFFCIVNLHAITVPHDPAQLAEKTRDLARIYIAVGIDPQVSTVFVQSDVKEHAELTWVLNCVARVPELERMTQYKEKARKQQENISV